MTSRSPQDANLPYWINALAEAAGIDAAMQISLERGGSRLCIPQKAEGSVLETIVDTPAARKIVEALADERFEVPLASHALVFWLRDKGWTQERISSRLRISRRNVQYILSGNTPRREPFNEITP